MKSEARYQEITKEIWEGDNEGLNIRQETKREGNLRRWTKVLIPYVWETEGEGQR